MINLLFAQANRELISNPTKFESVGPILVKVVEILLLGAGVVAIVFFIVGGFTYLASAGNPEQVMKAKATILYAVMGLLVSLLAVYLVEYIFVVRLGISSSLLHL